MEIWRIEPTYKDYVWGGTKLKEDYHAITDKKIVAESWVLSCHPDGPNKILNGKYKGKVLADVLNDKKLWGTNGAQFERFPILTKIIASNGSLSIQVHPNDELGWKLEKGYGKTEAWFVLEAEPGAAVYFGLNKDLTKEQFRAHIENNTITDDLNYIEVKPGDVLFVEAGTIHALCKGAVIVEVQQNSNTTYRIYDYNRPGVDGKPRELHIEKSILVSNLNKLDPDFSPAKPPVQINGGRLTLLACCKYFIEELYEVESEVKIHLSDKSFKQILAVKGSGVIIADGESYEFSQGESFFIPAQSGEITIKGRCNIVTCSI